MCAIGWGLACVARGNKDSELDKTREVDGEEEKEKTRQIWQKKGLQKK